MEKSLVSQEKEKIIDDLLLIKRELDGRKESILANPVAVLSGNSAEVLEEVGDEFRVKYAQFTYKAGGYLAELELSREEMLKLSILLVLKEQGLRNGVLLRGLELISSIWVTLILAIPVFLFVNNLIIGVLLLVAIWYLKNKIIDVKANLIHQAQDYGWLQLYFEDRLKADS